MKILSKLDNTEMIEETADKRFVTDAEKSTWNSKADKTYVDSQDALKADKTEVEANLELKADKTYVDDKVKTDVPVGAKFTDTVYTHPATHPASMITGLPTSLPANGGNADTVGGFTVGVNVPANAKFTDTNTTYSEISTAEIDAGTASTGRTITGRRVKYILDKVSSMISAAIGALTKSNVGLGNVDNTSDADKPISTATQAALDGKVNNSQVLTNVPSGAKFTDTITTINGKTGVISKADITALGIPAQDTVYSHPATHPASMITESSTKRFVSDTEKATWNSKSDTDTVTTINGKTGAISKEDIVALGIPASDTNTTYSEITTAEIDAGTASTRRTISGRRVQYIVDKAVSSVSGFAPTSHTHSASDINSGTLSYLRIPRGTTSTTVAIGNHTHSNYASTSHTHTSFSGLTLSNPLVCSNLTASTQAMNLKPNNGSGVGIIYAFGDFRPSNGQNLGYNKTTERWSNVYIKTGAINESSDIRLKDNITDIPKDLLRFFADEVKPKMFEIDGKTHFGYIAQDVERALYKYALDKVGLKNAREYVDEFNLLGKGDSYLSLVYNQVAILKEVELQDRIDKLELQIEELKSLID